MRISDWSSVVCSSDLVRVTPVTCRTASRPAVSCDRPIACQRAAISCGVGESASWVRAQRPLPRPRTVSSAKAQRAQLCPLLRGAPLSPAGRKGYLQTVRASTQAALDRSADTTDPLPPDDENPNTPP